MSATSSYIDQLSQAARPTLFDAAYQPELLFSLILANLMSPSLWEFSTQIQHRIDTNPKPDINHQNIIMAEIQHYVDQHLFHINPQDIESLWGFLDLNEERKRFDTDVVDETVKQIINNINYRKKVQTYDKKWDIMYDLINADKFPEYEYSILDIVRAHRRNLKQKKHKPIGVTACADEAILIASLSMVLKEACFKDILILGSPVHYTT